MGIGVDLREQDIAIKLLDLLVDDATLDGPFTSKHDESADVVVKFPSKEHAYRFAQLVFSLRVA